MNRRERRRVAWLGARRTFAAMIVAAGAAPFEPIPLSGALLCQVGAKWLKWTPREGFTEPDYKEVHMALTVHLANSVTTRAFSDLRAVIKRLDIAGSHAADASSQPTVRRDGTVGDDEIPF